MTSSLQSSLKSDKLIKLYKNLLRSALIRRLFAQYPANLLSLIVVSLATCQTFASSCCCCCCCFCCFCCCCCCCYYYCHKSICHRCCTALEYYFSRACACARVCERLGQLRRTGADRKPKNLSRKLSLSFSFR